MYEDRIRTQDYATSTLFCLIEALSIASFAQEVEYVARTCDGDAYNCSGQKCSAQSILFMHESWEKDSNLLEQMEALAAKRSLQDLTIGPVLTWWG